MPEELQKHMTIDMRSKLLGEEEQPPVPKQLQQKPTHKEDKEEEVRVQAAATAAADMLKVKFTRAATTLTSTVTAPGLHSAVQFVRSQKEQAGSPGEEPHKPQHVFTRATRETREWAPTKLLCKRLGVDVPLTGGAAGAPSEDDEHQQPAAAADALAAFAPTQAAVAARQPTGPPPPDDKLPQELLESSEAPALDLFKAIFDEPLPIEEPAPQEQKSDEKREESVVQQRQTVQPQEQAEKQEDHQEEMGEEPAQPMLFPEPPPGFVYHHEAGGPAEEHDEKHKHKHRHKHKHEHKHHKHKHHKHHGK